MISAGRSINPYGSGARQPRTKEELNKQLKQMRENMDKGTKKRIAKYTKADPMFGSNICPVALRDDKGHYVEEFGELCRKAKDNLKALLPNKPEQKHVAAIRHEILREVPKEEFMSAMQRMYLARYLSFKTKKRVKELLKKLKESPHDRAATKEYEKLHGADLKKYTKTLKSQLKEAYVLHEGKIYQKLNIKWIRANRKTDDTDLQCFDRSASSLEIYEDCICAIESAGNKCQDLTRDTFSQRPGKPAKGKIRSRIYYNPKTKELRLVPTKEGFVAPKDFTPIKLGSLKRFLSRHKGKKDGGRKLLLDLLAPTLSLKGKTPAEITKIIKGMIFLNEEDQFVADVDSVEFLSRFSVMNERVHKGKVYPAGIYLNEKEAKEFIEQVNSDPDCIKTMSGIAPFRETNFARSKNKEGGLWQYMIPKDPALLVKIFHLVDRMRKGKVKTSLSAKRLESMHIRLHHLVKGDLSATFRDEMTKWQKKFSEDSKKDQGFWAKLGLAGQAVFMIVIGISSYFSIKIGLASLKHMRIMMLQAVDARKANRLLKMDQDKLDEKERLTNIKKLEKKEKRGKLTLDEKRTLSTLRKAQEKHITDQGMEPWEREILDLSVKDKSMKGELVDYAVNLLRNRPNEPIPGRDFEAWEVLRSRSNTGEETSPFVYGVSGSGKRYVHQAAAEKIAMAYLYDNDRTELQERLRIIYQERYDAHPEFFQNDPASVQREVDHYITKYKEASDNLDPMLREHRFFLIHNAKLQAGTSFRGAQADKVLQCFAANEHNATPVMQEFATILMAGATGGGGGQDVDASESVLELTKQHIEGTSDDGEEKDVDKEAKEKGETANGINADSTPHRTLKVRTDGRSEDLRRRFLWIANNAWSPKETLEHIQAPRIYGPIERKYKVRLSPEALEAAVRIGVHYEGKPGRTPLTAANSVLKGAAGFVVKAEKRTGWDGKTPIVITAQNMYDYAESRYNVKIENRADVGKLKMEQPREYFMFKRDVRAMKELDSGTVTILPSNRAKSENVSIFMSPKEKGIVRKIATTMDLDAIGDFEDVERNPRKAQEAARLAVTYARRLHKLGGDNIPKNVNELQMWIEQNIDRVLPVSDEVVEKAETVLQEEILRSMDPTRYETDSIEERNDLMLKDAAKIEANIYKEHDIEGNKSLHELIQKIPDAVAKHEADLGKPPTPDGTPPGNGRKPRNGKRKGPPPPAPPPPRPASENTPKSRARSQITARVESLLPKSLKPYAKHVAVVCEHKPELLRLNASTQRAIFTSMATKAMERHPEVIGGTKAGVQAAKARRARREGKEIDGKERRAAEAERMRRLREAQRRKRAARATK